MCRMVQRREQLRFAGEAGGALDVAGDGLGQQLDRDIAAEAGVAGAINLAHATRR